MAELVHVYSTHANTTTFDTDKSGPQRAAATGARAIAVSDVADFKVSLLQLKNTGVKVDRMVIETHGSPGAIYLGTSRFDSTTLARFVGNGIDEIFVENARIFLNGCNIAEQSECDTGGCNIAGDGRKFLKEFAVIFLSKNGGRVGASTSRGLANPINNKVYHLWGSTVYAYVKKGGRTARIAVGSELAGPNGQWLVKTDGNTYTYWFSLTPQQKVTWEDDALIGGESGKGTWSSDGNVVRINWESGASEEWDLPLFSEEQSGVWKKTGGAVSPIVAKKIIDKSYSPFGNG